MASFDHATSAPVWESDDSATCCRQCSDEFTLTRRRHHCRGCGKVFCSKCCSRHLKLPFVDETVTRTCEACFRKHSSIDYDRHTDVMGPPSAPAVVVFVHGALTSRKFFAPQLAELSSKGYRCVAVDLPGHGSRADEPLLVRTSIEVIEAAVRAETTSDATRVAIVGIELGALLAATFAKKHPEMCHALVLLGAVNNLKNPCFGMKYSGTVFSLLSETVVMKALLHLSKVEAVPAPTIDEVFLRPGLNNHMWPTCAQMFADVRPRMPATLKEYKGPALLVHGETEVREHEAAYMEACHDGRLHIVKQGTSMITLDPRFQTEVNEVILDFLADVGVGRGRK